jgi:hypothetical protein
MHEVSVSFAYDGCDLTASRGVLKILRKKFYSVVRAVSNAKDWASQVSTELKNKAQSRILSLIVCCTRNFLKKIFP